MKEDASVMMEWIDRVAAKLSSILADNDSGNVDEKFLEYCERIGKKRDYPFRTIVENLYKGFCKEQEEKLSSWEREMLAVRQHRLSGMGDATGVNYVPGLINYSGTGASDYSL